jgi:uncharacterized protein (DUF952 family)
MILHITTHTAWEKAKMKGEYSAPSLKSEGFIHCSMLNSKIPLKTSHVQLSSENDR